jgi:hypothetical protein
MNFSKKYLKLTESMRSTSEEDLLEDKDTRKQRKEERKEKRQEKKFNQGGSEEYSSGTGKFNLNAFLKALTALKNQIISQLTDADTVKKINPDLKTPEKYKSEFMGLLERTAKLMGDVEYTRSKEGRKLESGDETLISGYRDIYNKIEAQFKEKKEAYIKEVQEERIEAQKGLEFKGILDPLNSAITKFGEAEVMMTELLTNLSNKAQAGEAGEAGSGTVSQLKIEKPISEWTKGKPANDKVKEIQQMIFDKFKGNSDVTETQIWKDFSSGNFADGKNGRKTSNIVIALKSAFGLADTSSDITQEFVDQLMDVKESVSLSESIISYDVFIAPKKIKEGFDPAAFKKAAGDIKKPAAGGGGGAPAAFDAFDSKEEGNKFRAWVNDKHPEWAKENSLGKEGSHTNSYIKKSWDTFKDEYEKREADKDKKEDKEEKEEITESSAKEMAEKADEMLRDASTKVKDFYSNEDNFSEYKGINDDEDAAVEYIFGSSYSDKSSWFYKNIRRKYTKPVYQTIKKLKEKGEKYEDYYIHLQDELDKVIKLYSILKKKTYGGTSSDTYKWSHTNLDGEKKSFYVDTDF